MNHMFSESAKYAIQAMIYLAENQKDGLILVSQISEDYDIPKFYLSKLIQTLSKNNLLKSSRGRRGGIKLSKPAKDIRIIDIVHIIDGLPPENEMCLFGLDICSDSVPCPVHDVWKKMKQEINDKLMNQNLEFLAKEINRKHIQLKKLLNQK